MAEIKQSVKWIRINRWLHRKLAVALFLFFVLMAASGLLLGIKKQTGLLAPTQKGVSVNAAEWMPMAALTQRAVQYLHDSVDAKLSEEVDRIDIRPGKGIAKFIYKKHLYGLQLDLSTGQLLSIEKRHSDFIESLHDGSIVDDLLGTGDEPFKVGYNIVMGVSLLLLVLSGLWLWYGPKRIRAQKRNR